MRTDRFIEKTQQALQVAASIGEFSDGDTVKVDVVDGDLVFRKVVAAVPAAVEA